MGTCIQTKINIQHAHAMYAHIRCAEAKKNYASINLMTSNKLGQIVWTGCMKDKWRYPPESGRDIKVNDKRDIKVNDISVNKVT